MKNVPRMCSYTVATRNTVVIALIVEHSVVLGDLFVLNVFILNCQLLGTNSFQVIFPFFDQFWIMTIRFGQTDLFFVSICT